MKILLNLLMNIINKRKEMIKMLQKPKGTKDILPEESFIWNYVENYIKTYVPQLSVGSFLKKINYVN